MTSKTSGLGVEYRWSWPCPCTCQRCKRYLSLRDRDETETFARPRPRRFFAIFNLQHCAKTMNGHSQSHALALQQRSKRLCILACKRDRTARDRDETVETETFDFQSETRSRPRPSHISTRPRRDRDVRKVRLESVSRPRRRDQDYIPGTCYPRAHPCPELRRPNSLSPRRLYTLSTYIHG